MNKFVSFEMVFVNGQKFLGNMCLRYSDITSDRDVKNVETYILQKLNAGVDLIDRVDLVTLTNWKAL